MLRPFVIGSLFASTALLGVASPAAILCASTLPDEVECIGAGGSCDDQAVTRATGGAIPRIDVRAPQELVGLLACTSEGNDQCDDKGRWTVRAGFTEGSGTVSIAAYCGDTSVAACSTRAAGVPCEDIGDSGTGTFSCVILVDGAIDTEDVSGECVDPLDPTRVVAATLLVADAVLSK